MKSTKYFEEVFGSFKALKVQKITQLDEIIF